MSPEERPTFGFGRSSRLRLIVGILFIIIFALILTGMMEDVFWAFVGYTLRHGG